VYWSLTSLREKVVEIRAKIVNLRRYAIFQMAEVAVPHEPFSHMLGGITLLPPPDTPMLTLEPMNADGPR